MIGIVDYGAGNLTSVTLALEYLQQESFVSDDSGTLLKADRLIFPGVGAAGSSMKTLRQKGLVETLQEYKQSGKPMLGICLGAQIVLEYSVEDGGVPCAGLIPGRTEKFVSTESHPIKIPEIGWNFVKPNKSHTLFNGLEQGDWFYFVHSYYPVPAQSEHILASTEYGATQFCSVLENGNLVASQFHPERSGKAGLTLLKNFCEWEF